MYLTITPVYNLSSLLQERIEMTRVAEEVAREAAEAIRQMASERQSIGLSLGSKELLQEEPEEE